MNLRASPRVSSLGRLSVRSATALRRNRFGACMTETSRIPGRRASRIAQVAPVLLVALWDIVWIAFHASPDAYAHTLFQTLALAESLVAVVAPAHAARRARRDPRRLSRVQLDPLLLPTMLIALFTLTALAERRTALLATAATATAVAALPLTGRGLTDLAAYLLPRLLAVTTAAAIGLWAQSHTSPETP